MNKIIKTEIAKIVAQRIEYVENFKKKSYYERAKVWEKYGKRRLYVPRNAYEQAGYIDLNDRSVHETRPGNYSTLIDALQMIEDCEAKEIKNP